MSLLLTLLLLVCMAGRALAAPDPAPGWVVDQWDHDDGLPIDHLNDLALDEQGVLWIATYDGLVRFDGVAFETLRSEHPLGPPSSRVAHLVPDPAGDGIWLIDERGQLQRRTPAGVESFDPERFRVRAVPTSGQDSVWAATEAGLVRLDQQPELLPTPGLEPAFVVAQPDGDLWVVDVQQGAWLVDPATGHVESLGRLPPDATQPERLAETGQATMRTTTATLWSCARGPAGCAQIPAQPTVGIQRPPRPARWTNDGPRILFDGQQVATSPAPIMAILPTADSAWVSTTGGGLLRVRPAPVQAIRAPAGGRSNVQRLWWEEAQQTLWAQAEAQGWWPVHYLGDAPVPLPPPDLDHPEQCPLWTWAYASDEHGQRWLSCGAKLLRRQGGAWIDETPPGKWGQGPSWTTRRGLWHSALPEGIWLREGEAWQPVAAGEGQLEGVYSLVERADGSVLLGGKAGLFEVARDEHQAHALPGGAAVGAIRDLWPAGDWLWMATEEHGLCVTSRAAPMAEAPRCLAGAALAGRLLLHAILADDQGRTWLSSNHGIGVVATAQLQTWAGGGPEPAPLWLDEGDGLLSDEGNGFVGDGARKTPDGLLFFATQDGVARVDPTTFTLPERPAVHWAEADVGPTHRFSPTRLDLETEHPPVTLRWGTAAGPWSDQVQFRYRLGTDRPWSAPTRHRSLHLGGVGPGEQLLELQTRLAGAWTTAAVLPLVRAPALHERAFFPLLLGLGLVGMLLAIVAGRGLFLARLNRRLQERVADQTRRLGLQNSTLRGLNQVLADQGEELRQQNLQLATHSEELRARNTQVLAQARELGELDRLKRQLIANVSHELRTPLSLVLAPLSRLQAAADPGSQAHDHLGLALDSAQRLEELIGQLFDLSRAQAGGLRLKARRLDLVALVEELVHRFEVLAARRQVQLEPVLPPQPVPAWVDRGALDKILTNLLANALRFAPAGSVIQVRLEAGEQAVAIEVQDEGPGVGEDQHEAVFERFFQGDGQQARVHGGAGLGLALARELAELHGGALELRPSQSGACFRLSLPLGSVHLDPDEVDLEPGPVPTSTPVLSPAEPEASAAQVLLVEDHDQLRAFLGETLSERFQVQTARGGVEALELLAGRRFDLLISDIMMPGMDGLELVRQLRALPGGESLPVMFVSARQELDDRVAGLALADDYLAKPFQVPELLARASALLRRRARAAEEDGYVPVVQTAADRFLMRLRDVAEPRLATRDFTAGALAKALAMSPRTLQLRMHEHGLPTPGEWLRQLRLEEGQRLLRSGELGTVSEVAGAVGMTRSYFSRVYAAWSGHSPSDDLAR